MNRVEIDALVQQMWQMDDSALGNDRPCYSSDLASQTQSLM